MSDSPKYVVAGIGTDVGKTMVSAVLVTGMEADYWKPVQAGTTPQTDSARIAALTGVPASRIHPEAYLLKAPESPHAAAAKEGLEIEAARLYALPQTTRPLIIEGAGGLMVPLNEEVLYLDILREWRLPVILVARLYLGAINHSLLSIDALETRGIEPLGIVFCGEQAPDMEQFILNYSGLDKIGHVPLFDSDPTPEQLKEVFDRHFNL
ncbi:MAG: dethiobiotin synthase [Bacteroidetes bacterium]|nr:dethiobiotin synthase [Bacteroidota bacterium]